MKSSKRMTSGPNRGTGNGRITYSTQAPVDPRHGDEWIEPVDFTTVPETSTSDGTPGQLAADSNYLYVCYAVNSWFRIPKGTW
jgi:hypothetical protein